MARSSSSPVALINHFSCPGPRGAIYRRRRFASHAEQKSVAIDKFPRDLIAFVAHRFHSESLIESWELFDRHWYLRIGKSCSLVPIQSMFATFINHIIDKDPPSPTSYLFFYYPKGVKPRAANLIPNPETSVDRKGKRNSRSRKRK